MKRSGILYAVVLIAAVVGLSILSVDLWGGKSEETELPQLVISSTTQPLAEIARRNEIPLKVVMKTFKVDSARAESIGLADLNLSIEEAGVDLRKTLVTYYEEQSKDWRKIFIKFLLWFLVLPLPVILIRRRKMTPARRRMFYLLSAALFGVILGSDPSPMGTVKDALLLITAYKTIFLPRIIALAIFLTTVIISTKLICSWGCQFGVLQDVLFRFGRNKLDRRRVFKQIKVPFWLSNTTRITFFLAAGLAGLLWAVDIVGAIDPFRIYKPPALDFLGAGFLLIVLIASLFIYRPWCHFACPFGLVSWFFEKLAIFRIRVDYNKCDACQICSASCPSTVMDAILKKERVIPDCFGCGVCVESCPTEAIEISTSRHNSGSYADALHNLEAKREALKVRKED